MDSSTLISILTDLGAEDDWMRISGYANMADKEHTFPYEIKLADDDPTGSFYVHYEILDADWGEVEESISFRIPFQEANSLADLQQRIHDHILSIMRGNAPEEGA